ncbi:pro-MCH [Eublepharis macularius]|uniref:Pro-MCH n=1 Tax=Eublepharis macularius TaxID=481883 RepID=A0AA97L6C2_EUBMA|nr:pro-MCH [Eublepharis macularius]
MRIPSYALILIFSLFSQGFLLSVSKSMRKAEDDMLLSAFSLGKVIQNGGKAEKSLPASSLEHYKIEDSSFLNEEEDGAPKFSNTGLKHHVISHSRPLNLPLKQLPYFSLEEPAAFPAEAEVQSIESIQERRETGDDENSAKLPIGRRDFDMLRCMLGRVYRPCWQV